MKYAQLGSISTGTLHTQDLLEAFTNELEAQSNENWARQAFDADTRTRHLDLIRLGHRLQLSTNEEDDEPAADLVNDLQDTLGEFAAPYCYFGTHEGDGADFGYWPNMEEIEELPRVESSDEAEELGEDCLYVNDHGNCTVYGGDGSVILELV